MNRWSWSDLGSRPLLFPALTFALGAWVGVRTGPIFGKFLVVSAALLALSALWGRRTGAHLLLLAGLFSAGASLSLLAARVEVPGPLPPGELRLEGRVAREATSDGRTVLELEVARVDGRPVEFGARLAGEGRPEGLGPGAWVELRGKLRRIEGPSNPGEADRAEAGARRGLLYAGGFTRGSLIVRSEPAPGARWLDKVHRALAERVHALSPTPDAAALYLTLAAGLRAELDPRLEEDFSKSGLAHLLSVSGLHVAVLAFAVLKLLRAIAVRSLGGLGRRFDVRRLAGPASLPLVWAYVAFTGNQAPAIRSAIMTSLVLLAMAVWRRADALNALAAAALGMIALDPSSVGDLSLQLSFSAVASLVLLSPAVREALPIAAPDPALPYYRLQKAREAVVQTVCASLAVTVTSAPLVASAFQRLSLAGIASNVVALPLSGALTLLAAGGAALFLVSPWLATPVLWVGGWASQAMLFIAERFARMPGASFAVPAPSKVAAGLLLLGLGAFALGRGRVRWGTLLAPIGVALWLVAPLVPPPGGMTVTFLSVGHGDAVVVRSGGRTALIDGGGVPHGSDPGTRVVVPYLRNQGVRRLALAVLSHPHPDHALGLISAVRALGAERVWLAAGTTEGFLSRELISAAGPAEVEAVEAGHPSFALGEATVEVLAPPVDRELLEGVNDQSVVLRIRHGAVTVLLPGDIEAPGEESLDPGPVTLLKAPHHGSRTSSSPEFLARVRPRHVVFCVGLDNRFGFPHGEVVGRYRALGARCHRTDLEGAITFTSDGQDVRVESFRPGTPREDLPVAALPETAHL